MENELSTPDPNHYDFSDVEKSNPRMRYFRSENDDCENPTTSSSKSENTVVRYKSAWKKVYGNLPIWRQKEIDNQLKTGSLTNKDWDTDFVRQVIALAESDDPQAI